MADTDLSYETAGSGPRVLLIQGTGAAGCAWSPQVEGLRDRFTLAWFDNRGVGGSPGAPTTLDAMADDAAAVLDALGWEQAHVVGHSLGGVIAQALALRHPSRVRSLALLCTFLQGRTALPSRWADVSVQLRAGVGPAAWRRRAFFELVSDPRLPFSEAHAGALEAVFRRALHAQPPATMKQVRVLFGADLSAGLPGLALPALVVSATDDRLAAVAQGRALADALQARFVEVAGGHAVTVQDAATINALLAEFWEGL